MNLYRTIVRISVRFRKKTDRNAAMRAARKTLRAISKRILLEEKIKLDGSVQQFNIEYVGTYANSSKESFVVGKWVAQEASYGLSPQSYSFGVWPLSTDAIWGAYRIHLPNDELVCYRFDCVERIEFKDDGDAARVSFRDLILDARVYDRDRPRVVLEDEKEAKEVINAGLLRPDQIGRITTFKRHMQSIQEIDRILSLVDEAIRGVASKPA